MPSDKFDLDIVFHPKSIAVIGASLAEPDRSWVTRQIEYGFKGPVYPIHPSASEVNEIKAYRSILDVPGPVDYAIFNIPARLTPQAMAECVEKKVKVVHVYTAGFSESGKEQGIKLEASIKKIAREGGVRVIGPNCMGIFCPESGLSFSMGFLKQTGNVAFVAQSGSACNRLVRIANKRHILFSKVISYGNAIDLNSYDFLEYLADDEQTSIIACYVEGVGNGQRYLAAIQKCLAKKPVVVMKAGLTEGGAAAAQSHSASLAGSKSVWEAFVRQTGIIPADSLEEIVDVVTCLQYKTAPKGHRVGIVGRGGGIGVMAADACERNGLKVPAFADETRRQLESIVAVAGAGSRNPVETGNALDSAADFYIQGLKMVDSDPNIDFILTHIGVDIYAGRKQSVREEIMMAAKSLSAAVPVLTKPIVVVLYPGENLETTAAVMEARDMMLKAGIPVFLSVDAASKAVNRVINFYEFRDNL